MSSSNLRVAVSLVCALSLAGPACAGKNSAGDGKGRHDDSKGSSTAPVWPSGDLGPANFLRVHGPALQGDGFEAFRLVVMGLPASAKGSENTSGTAKGKVHFGGLLNIAGENSGIVNLKLKFDDKASKDASNSTTEGRMISLEGQLVKAPVVEGQFTDDLEAEIAAGKPDKGEVIGSFTAKVVPKRAARFRGQDINVPFLVGTAKIDGQGTFRLYGRVWAGPTARESTQTRGGTQVPAATQGQPPSSPQQGF